MLKVVICEDAPKHRQQIEMIVNEYINTVNSDIMIALSTENPNNVLKYAQEKFREPNVYLLDVDLKREITGIELAALIRKTDITAAIVFITTHKDFAYLAFKHKVEALDYIIKDDRKQVKPRVYECLEKAYNNYRESNGHENKVYSIKSAGEVWNIPIGDIYFFESHPSKRHNLILHAKGTQIEFRGFISSVAETDPAFVMTNQSYVINANNMKRLDKKNKEIEMINGEIVPLSRRKLGEITDKLDELGKSIPIT